MVSETAYIKNDYSFDHFFPTNIRDLSKRHWTPLAVAKEAAQFLSASADARILDIGSGIGKFCIIAAHFCPHVSFHGIEQREELINFSLAAKEFFQKDNVEFIHGNFTQLELDKYDHFYFYNSFLENIDDTDRIDQQIDYSHSLYAYYFNYLFNELDNRPSGTRLVTYDGSISQIPSSYQLMKVSHFSSLKMWIKK